MQVLFDNLALFLNRFFVVAVVAKCGIVVKIGVGLALAFSIIPHF